MGLRLLFIGDVVGNPGRAIVGQALPRLRHRWDLDLVVCNAENAAGGSGLTGKCYDELVEAGVDAFTMGDHVFKRDEIFDLFERSSRICRPANLPPEAPGPEVVLVEARDGTPVGIISLLGRTYMKPVDCPFRTSDRLLDQIGVSVPVILVDIHAEATSEKQLLGRYLDGRVTAVLGTHTHVPTADEQIFVGGTGYQTDVGMTGPYDSVIGRRYDRVLASTLTGVFHHFEIAQGDPRLCGTLLEIDPHEGRTLRIRRVEINQEIAQRLLTSSEAEDPFDPVVVADC